MKSDTDEVSLVKISGGCSATPPGPMSIMSWNCRVLSNPWSVQTLKKVIRKEYPNLVFLMETKLEKKDMKKVQEEIGIL